MNDTVVLGGGVSGLAAGISSGAVVFEASEAPGGICSSYYLRPGSTERLTAPPEDGEVYRFEIGGGHWIFGLDPHLRKFLGGFCELKNYSRHSSAFFPGTGHLVPYPVQNHLSHFGPAFAVESLAQIEALASSEGGAPTMSEWLEATFGGRLCDAFFHPFHRLYTAGLWEKIAPQDQYKTPVDLARVRAGACGDGAAVGYNATFAYPADGLDSMIARMAERCDLRLRKRAARVNTVRREIEFSDGTGAKYAQLISTLPLNKIEKLCGFPALRQPDPGPAVLVLNLGARKGPRAPSEQWLYIPESRAGFHRVGFYSNVDPSFLPHSHRADGSRVSVYVEKAYPEGDGLSPAAAEQWTASVAGELQEWGWIGDVEAADPTWIEVAYTWSWPGSTWKTEALARLEHAGVYCVGRYARWTFQGIAESIRDGLVAGMGNSDLSVARRS